MRNWIIVCISMQCVLSFIPFGLDKILYQKSYFFYKNPDKKPIYITTKAKTNIMKLLHSATKFFKFFDLFSTSQFLRFQEESQYKTASGGICSLIVIAIFMALFMSTAIQTINMQIIAWSSTSQLLFDPSETIVPINPPNSPFMFAIKLLGLNLNDNVRYFDITMVQREYINGLYEVTPRFVEMVPCTSQHFSLTDQIKKNSANLAIQTWLCPPIGYNFSVKGKFTSADMNLLEVRVTKCNATKDLTRPCANNATIDFYQQMFEQFILSLNFINPLINPGDQNYLSYYIEDISYLKFTRKLGADSNGHIEDYTIETDVSLLPFTKNVVDSGVIIPQIFQNIAFQVTGNRYASFFFMKSAKSTTYTRSFNKLDSFFSYVGGLVGTILGLMFIVASFTSMAYELELSERIFCYTQDKVNDFSSFSLLSYCAFVIYGIGKLFGLGKGFSVMRQVEECSEEVTKQLDVQLLLQRLLFLERATETLLQEHQLQGLHMHRLDTLKDIKKRRKRYTLRYGKPQYSNNHDDSIQDQQHSSNEKSSHSSSLSHQHTELQIHKNNKDYNLQQVTNKVHNQAYITNISKIIQKLKVDSENGNKISKKIISGIEFTHKNEDDRQPQQIRHMEVGAVNLKSPRNMQIQFQFLE